ncbi:hypothetical protein KSP40_PGU006877 [Platanthera guangdongensis]|uniref:Uncharacterized protein n=1 Tax=Platanthera guangdongensis TaxID=2320717 RepID=A0ABR2LD55_9ASPA
MTSSPALRCSPAWDRGAESSHKRGRSLESGLTLKTKDDDLLLFNEMRNQERDNFLLHTLDDFDESLSKLRHFSNFKLGISIPTRGDAGDLLNVEGDKSDYDWLLTPPDTPLFSSLDDEFPQPVTLAPRGRARSQPIMISRSMNEKSQQTSRTGSSPHRLSPSPRSSGISAQMRGRPSLAPRSSTPTVTRSATPARRPSTPPKKQSTPTPSSSTPILRRSSTGSSVLSSSYGGRGPSPVKTSHGNSASPKLQGWQIALPGFTLEAPPNLRTSLSDRPMSHTRGSSPASRNGSESSGRLGRKSMSPTSSRSIGSSHSHDRDQFSSYSKCSMVSSSDDYEESLRSITVGISRSPLARKDGSLGSNKAMPFARKPSRNSTVNCVPKRSFDSALRVMDRHKTPQNMFRPLMSSVPATTFRPIFSRNSSLTTSSNASSEQGVVNVALDVEGRELESTEQLIGWERAEDSETLEEVFLFDKADEIIKDASHEALYRKPQRLDEDFGETSSKKFDSEDIQNPMVHIGTETNTTLDSTHFTDRDRDVDGHKLMKFCSKCSRKFMILDATEITILCQECIKEDRTCTAEIDLTCVPLNKIVGSQMDATVCTLEKGLLSIDTPEFHEGNDKIMLHQHDRNIISESNSLLNICSTQLLNQMEFEISDLNLDRKKNMNDTQLSNHAVNSSLKVDIAEGTGISVLLMQRSNSIKWPILQGRTVSATNILCSEPSYSRDNNTNASRRSSGRDGLSTSSSVDLVGSYMQTENSIQHQLYREDAVENMRNATDNEETSSSYTKFLGHDREILVATEEHVDTLDGSNVNISSPSRPVFSDIYIISEGTDTLKATHSSESEQILDRQGNHDLPCSSAPEIMCDEDSMSSIHADEHNNEINAQSVDGKNNISGCSEMEDDYTMLNCTSQYDNVDETTKYSPTLNIELLQSFSALEDCQTEFIGSHCPDYLEQSNGDTVSQSVCDISLSTSEPITAVQEHGNRGARGKRNPSNDASGYLGSGELHESGYLHESDAALSIYLLYKTIFDSLAWHLDTHALTCTRMIDLTTRQLSQRYEDLYGLSSFCS